MTDITDQILEERYDPLNEPLRPSVGAIEEYAHSIRSEIAEWLPEHDYLDDLTDYDNAIANEGNQITYQWATNEILQHQMNWIRVGLVAERVRRYRLYRAKFKDWKTYCSEALGKFAWQINKDIDAALLALELIREGFDILPKCKTHVQKLMECCQKSGDLAVDAWYRVTEALPKQVLITGNSIMEILGFASEKSRISLPKILRDRLQRVADEEGVKIDRKIEQLLDIEEGIERDENGEIIEETPEEIEAKNQRWRDDMASLIEEKQESDRQFWFIAALTRIVEPVKEKVSQFSHLREIRYQN